MVGSVVAGLTVPAPLQLPTGGCIFCFRQKYCNDKRPTNYPADCLPFDNWWGVVMRCVFVMGAC